MEAPMPTYDVSAIGLYILVRGLLYPPKLKEAKLIAPLGLFGGASAADSADPFAGLLGTPAPAAAPAPVATPGSNNDDPFAVFAAPLKPVSSPAAESPPLHDPFAPPPPPPPTTETTTTPTMTTSYIRLPFVPVPIPIQVPKGPDQPAESQPPANPYYPGQQNPYGQYPQPYPQYPQQYPY